MSESIEAFLGIGSNLGDRRGTIDSALKLLKAARGIEILAISTIIETDPVGPQDQGAYLNGAIKIVTSLRPQSLLETCLQIERTHGRDRKDGVRWGPRTLDLDILLYGELVISEPGLEIPHSRMHERAFVLVPLAEIGPSCWHPVLEMSIQDIKDQLVVAP